MVIVLLIFASDFIEDDNGKQHGKDNSESNNEPTNPEHDEKNGTKSPNLENDGKGMYQFNPKTMLKKKS